jgi:hypothetical protein
MSKESLVNKEMVINGLSLSADFYQEDIDNIFIPLLQQLTNMQHALGRRIIVFIAAAPGTGKSTLVSFLEYLSCECVNIKPLQAIGIDGFHYPNTYLESNHIDQDPSKPLLKSIKGAPTTFDVEKLERYLGLLSQQNPIWPVYSRVTHDVSDNGDQVDHDIILLEGNYLLLRDAPWSNLIHYADYTIFLKSDEATLKKHLVDRKHAGGFSPEEAIAHYLHTDAINIALVNEHSRKADLTLSIDACMKYHVIE